SPCRSGNRSPLFRSSILSIVHCAFAIFNKSRKRSVSRLFKEILRKHLFLHVSIVHLFSSMSHALFGGPQCADDRLRLASSKHPVAISPRKGVGRKDLVDSLAGYSAGGGAYEGMPHSTTCDPLCPGIVRFVSTFTMRNNIAYTANQIIKVCSSCF